MAAAALAATLVGSFSDPVIGMAAVLALFGAAALACGRIARDRADEVALLSLSAASPPCRSPRP